ncbi:hypothetical protein NEOLEDRAFT_846135 [Neolentinus lepideus HHB14362 ss-1]|uniref:Uncharacterized protein n=1 Tax=Neolentinus lepideus HHB14362 ss-1 TaxID=1314782 RepID=A0A165UND6_9AGAM|nr:hypothetical protein NEOLEDRAFT_846135 [Neolentinus lepideus HHB14362 ss-1]
MDTQSLTTDSDTQATQILENLTHGGTNMWRPPIPAAEPEPMLDESLSNYSKDNSAESSDPHSAAPRHNFYGLAIQSQYNDLSGNEDSQKENTPAPCDSRLQRPSTPGPHSVVSSASGSKTGGKIPTSDDNNRPFADTSFQTPGNATTGLEDVLPEIRNDTSRSPFKVNIALSGPSTKAVSFMSPNSKTITSAPVVAQRRGRFRPKLMRRDPSPPASQDSFIDPLPDPAKAYIATDRQFQIPLSQLGEDSLSQSSMRASSPDRISHQLPSRRDPSRSNSPSHIATVLVAATPSSSGSSNSSQDPASQDSLLYSASQDVNWYSNGQPDREASPLYPYHINLRSSAPRDNSQQSEPEVWQPTQAVDELSQSSSEDGNQFPPSTVSATQATQYQETQLISGSSGIRQEPPSADPHPLLSEPVAYSNAPSTSTKATSAVPNSLLSLVDPSKRHRYEGIVAEARGDRVPDVPMPPPRRTVPKPQTSRAAATQQTRDGSVYSINRTRTAPTESSSEVVPDSEPARLARLESSPSVPLADIRKRVSNLSREEEEDQGVATEVEENPDDHHHGPFIPPPVVNKRKGKAGVSPTLQL